METVTQYLSRLERDINSCDYRGCHCTELSKEVAQRLVAEGRSPLIMRIGRKEEVIFDRQIDIVSVGELIPRKYPDIIWRYHDICVERGVVYDPLVGRPLPIQQYLEEAFGSEFEIAELVCSER